MSSTFVLYALFTSAVVLFVADEATQLAASHSVPRQLIANIASAPKNIDVLGIGNSLIAAGFDSPTLQRSLRRPNHQCITLNGGLGASGTIEHLALTRLALRHHSVKLLVYGFFDQQLSSADPKTNAEVIGNRNMLYYQEPELALQYS